MTDSHQATFDALSDDTAKLEGIDWTFKNATTDYLTHGLHPYPARMIPQIPRTLLRHYKSEGILNDNDLVFDPFTGSGTTLVEASLHGLNSIGSDVNPFACHITRAKTTPLPESEITNAIADLLGSENDTKSLKTAFAELDQLHSKNELREISDIEIRDDWFPEPQLHQLWEISTRISDLETTEHVKRFLYTTLAVTSRKVSYQRDSEFKRYRIPDEERNDHNPSVYDVFTRILDDNKNRVLTYTEQRNNVQTIVEQVNAKNVIECDALPVNENTADIMITSPPYGDHRTTVAYGQYSQDPALITGKYAYDEMKAVDKNGLGGTNSTSESVSEDDILRASETVQKTIDVLNEADGERADDAVDFLTDYYEIMHVVTDVVKSRQPIVWVVANRTMAGVQIPTHIITRELCESLGCEHKHTLPRDIPTKTLPWKNSPSNVVDETEELMSEENIVILNNAH